MGSARLQLSMPGPCLACMPEPLEDSACSRHALYNRLCKQFGLTGASAAGAGGQAAGRREVLRHPPLGDAAGKPAEQHHQPAIVIQTHSRLPLLSGLAV